MIEPFARAPNARRFEKRGSILVLVRTSDLTPFRGLSDALAELQSEGGEEDLCFDLSGPLTVVDPESELGRTLGRELTRSGMVITEQTQEVDMRIRLPRGRFLILHPLRIGLVLALVGVLTWAVGAFGAAPVARSPPAVVVPYLVDEWAPQVVSPPSVVENLEVVPLVLEIRAGELHDVPY